MSRRSWLVATLEHLVAADSANPPGGEAAVAAVVERAAAERGLPPLVRHARHPERPNLLLDVGHGFPRLLIAAHLDTVPAGDRAAWNTDPYALTAAGSRLVGLGAADMKGAVACMLEAAARLHAQPPSAGTVTFAFTADEERGSSDGMAWLCREGLVDADAAVMAEPSSTSGESWDALYVAQCGSSVIELSATGVPGHSSEPLASGARAATPFVAALTALLASHPFADRRHPVDGRAPLVNVATTVSGGVSPYAYPGRLAATVEVRTVPGMSEAEVLQGLRAIVHDAGLADRVTLEPVPGSWVPPGQPVTDGRLLAAAGAAWTAVLGRTPEHAVLGAATDSCHLDAIGIPTLPAFGPGSFVEAHRAGESIAASDLPIGAALLEHLAREYLLGFRRGYPG